MPKQHHRAGEARKKTKAPWSLTPGEVAESLEVSVDRGLTSKEARRRSRIYGPNQLQEPKRTSLRQVLWNQFKSLLIIILAAASIAAFVFGRWLEAFAVAAALVINVVIGFFTELKAIRSMEALQRLGKVRARVRRDGESREIHARNLVPGDVVLIEAGDVIAADLRLVEANNLQADESTLTGESVPVDKGTAPFDEGTALAERSNMLFKGTAATAGSGVGVVVATGMETELGKIASLAQKAEEEQTPLERRLEHLGRRLVLLTLVLGVIVAAGIAGGLDTVLVLETAIAMAIADPPARISGEFWKNAAVPESG